MTAGQDMTHRADADVPPARVLIVDDEPRNRQVLEIMLAAEGYQLETAASGGEALAMVAQHTPDVILLAITMPDMDGYTVARAIKANPVSENIIILLVSAIDHRDAKILGLTAGAVDVLTTPVDSAELKMRVRNLLRLSACGMARTADLIARTRALEQQTLVLARQAELLNLARDAIVVRDRHSVIGFWSTGAETMYGWSREEALGKVSYELLHTEFPAPLDQIEATVLGQGHWEGELIHYTRGGSRLTVDSRWALQRDPDGTPSGVLTINHDITERKQADVERLLQAERLSLATSLAKVGVWDWDVASNRLTWDATMFDLYGFPPVSGPVPYARWAAAVHPVDLPRVEATLQRAIAERGHGAAEFRIIMSDGSVKHVSAFETAVLDTQANIRVIGVNMDVTERKTADAFREESRDERMRFKDEFLSHVSHELRSPLTAIKQFTTILLGGLAGELNSDQRKYQQIVLKNIHQLQAMIDDLLEVTRLETGKLTVEAESVSVQDAVTDTFNTLQESARAKGITLSGHVSGDLPAALADQTRLRQMLIILLDNAIKFTPEGGAVRIEAGLLARDPRFLVVDVTDTGCGVSAEMIAKIFERHYQVSEHAPASRKGLGLGLYICKQLAARQGGEMWVTSREQEGSTFSFTLPVFSHDASETAILPTDKWPAASVALVLVEISFLEAWSSGDEQEAWAVEARRLLQRHVRPDMDVLLPKRISEAHGERFCVVASLAGEHDAAALAGRIREQFAMLPRLQQTRVTVSVSYSMLHPSPHASGAAMEDMVASLARNLEASIKTQIVAEAVHDE